ncbi:uncharacterized protein C18orf19 homolog A-like [Oppia nitens]|uniref:uncharacterized protein C18orf19 homolog A-like n=1 Tax=Oppia nitens TaxID=1686743 RepID=UPI0023DBEC12|nr:uncharacterized protein C18orf19 homolog A-like [Oppia nitens]
MFNLCQKSFCFLQSVKCRDICIKCVKSHNKWTQMTYSRSLNVWSTRSTPQLISSVKSIVNYNHTKRCLWTTFSQNQRLAQICRNAVKDTKQTIVKNVKEVPKVDEINEWKQMKQLSLTKKLKYMFVKYWYISIPVHCVTGLLWFGSCYIIAKSGFDVKPILEFIRPYAEKLPLPDFVYKVLNTDTNAGTAGYIAIALIMYKLVTPARYATTVGVSYYTIEFFVKRSLIKPVPSGQQIKAQVIKSRSQLNKVLRERLAKREELRKGFKNKPKTRIK